MIEVVEDGEMKALRKRRGQVPEGVVEFLRLPGVGPKTAARIWSELGITTLEALQAAAAEGRLRGLSGLGEKSEAKILKSLEAGAGRKEPREDRGLLGAGLPAVERVVAELSAHPAAIAVSEAGSVRRRRETVRDLDVIATSSDAPALIAAFCEGDWVAEVIARGDTKATVVGHQGLRFDLRVVPPECFGNVLQHFTGSKDHNVALREEAQRRGLSISEYGVAIEESDEVVTHPSEEELYEFLGYQYIPPELRETGVELKPAREHALPTLVELSDLRGELHCHSTWSSDARNSIEEMATTARGRGYKYLCVTDHSHYLREQRLEAQWREIEEVDARLKPFRVLKGIEVNIRADGTLDVAGRDSRPARLGRRVAAHLVRPEPDRADPGGDREPVRRLHRPSHRTAAPEAGGSSGGRGARRRASRGDRDGARDQLAAGPARHARHARAARGGGGRHHPGEHRRAFGGRARLRAARDWPGAARVVDEETDPEHALLDGHRAVAPKAAQDRRLTNLRDDGALALEWVASYLEGVRDLPVLSQVEPGQIRASLPASPPDEPEPFSNVLDDLDAVLLPGLTHWQSPRFFAYFATTGAEPGILAELLVAGLNQVGILWRTSPALQELEEVTLDWLAQLLGLPAGLHGHIEDTASTGTLSALAVARALHPDRRVVLCSEHAHSAADKAARLLELELRKVPVDDGFRMRMDQVDLEGACALIATIGTTGAAAVDPVPGLADLCAGEGVWLHVDAAYAGPAAICPELRPLFEGWERADSIGVNPHKWLGTPMDCSALWTRRPDDFRRTFSLVPEFLQSPDDAVNLSELSIPLGRRFRALKLWAVLRCFGRAGLQERIREHIRLAALFEGWVAAEHGWEVAAPRHFSLVCFRREGTDDDNERLLERVNASGEVFLSHARLGGRYCLRLAVGNYRTTEDDVRLAWDVLRREAAHL